MKTWIPFLFVFAFTCKTRPPVMSSFVNGKNDYRISVGQIQEIALTANSGTGFSWQCSNEQNDFISLIKKDKIRQPGAMPGAPETDIWQFKGIKKGTVTLKFVLKRVWEPEAAGQRDITITVQ